MPVLTPAELWEATGRVQDPGDLPARATAAAAQFVLPMTHEETFTFHARELQSLQAAAAVLVPLPDEGPRRAAAPRRAAPRARVHHEGLLLVRPRRGGPRRELPSCTRRRTTGSSSAAGSRCYAVQAESGMMGGSESIDFLAPVGLRREHARHVRARRLRGRPRDRARRSRARPEFPERARRAGGGRDAGRRRRSRRWPSSSASIPRRPRRRCRSSKDDGTVVLGARPRRRPARARRSWSRRSARRVRPATEDEIRDRVRRRPRLARARSASTVEVVADETLREGQFVAGANRTGWHLRGVEAGRDFEPRFADIRESRGGRHAARTAAARCASRRRSRSATSSSSARGTPSRSGRRSWTRTGRRSRSSWAATASAPAASMAAAVEQHHDEHGIIWPAALAPYDVHVVALPGRGGAGRRGRGASSRRRGMECCSTTATSAPGRSSRTPT